MANQKNEGGRQQQKQDKNPPEQRGPEQPARAPDEGEDGMERDRSGRDRDKDDKDDKDVQSGVISNDEDVEVEDLDEEDDDEGEQITGRHPSQRDRDLP